MLVLFAEAQPLAKEGPDFAVDGIDEMVALPWIALHYRHELLESGPSHSAGDSEQPILTVAAARPKLQTRCVLSAVGEVLSSA